MRKTLRAACLAILLLCLFSVALAAPEPDSKGAQDATRIITGEEVKTTENWVIAQRVRVRSDGRLVNSGHSIDINPAGELELDGNNNGSIERGADESESDYVARMLTHNGVLHNFGRIVGDGSIIGSGYIYNYDLGFGPGEVGDNLKKDDGNTNKNQHPTAEYNDEGRQTRIKDIVIPPLAAPVGGVFVVGDSHSMSYDLLNPLSDVYTYQWYKDDVLIPGETGKQLALTDMDEDDAGSYTCEITIDGTTRTATSAAAVISIAKPVPKTPIKGNALHATITATAGPNGRISPSGAQAVAAGANITFTFEADAGYAIKDVYVNGESKGRVASYTFVNVQENASIYVAFERAGGGYDHLPATGDQGGLPLYGLLLLAAGAALIRIVRRRAPQL